MARQGQTSQPTVDENYDVAARVKQMIPTSATVAGHTFGIKRSGKVLREIIKMGGEAEEFETDDAGNPKLDAEGEKVVKEDADASIQLLYESLALLFVDQETNRPVRLDSLLPPFDDREKDGEYPESFAEWLEWEMDIDAAQELLGKLVPKGDAPNPTVTVSAKES